MFILIKSLFRNFNSAYQLQGATYQKTFSVRDQGINSLDFIGNIVSVVTSQLCHYTVRAVIEYSRSPQKKGVVVFQ